MAEESIIVTVANTETGVEKDFDLKYESNPDSLKETINEELATDNWLVVEYTYPDGMCFDKGNHDLENALEWQHAIKKHGTEIAVAAFIAGCEPSSINFLESHDSWVTKAQQAVEDHEFSMDELYRYIDWDTMANDMRSVNQHLLAEFDDRIYLFA